VPRLGSVTTAQICPTDDSSLAASIDERRARGNLGGFAQKAAGSPRRFRTRQDPHYRAAWYERHHVAMAMPGRIVDLRVTRMDPDDFLVSFVLGSGETIALCGRDVCDPPLPSMDAAEVFGFLWAQNTPPELAYRELNAVDPQWEAGVEARRNSQSSAQARRQEDLDQRARLRDEFRRAREDRE
jgi:hypothetical protein